MWANMPRSDSVAFKFSIDVMDGRMELAFRQFFTHLTGKSPPFPYQERLADLLLAGRSVIFRAPTGAGKTWAAVAPFLYSIVRGNRIGDRLLYAVPLRTLATTIHSEVLQRAEQCGLLGQVEPRTEDRDYSGSVNYCCLQIGGQRSDPFFQADLTFTTIDQLLSSYLMHPVSLPPMLDNMNAGALIGAFLVFDELHLLEPSKALGTTIEMLHRLHREHQLCQFLLMTATLSDEAIDLIGRTLGAERFHISEEEVRALPAQSTKQRTWRWRSKPLTAANVFHEYCGGRAIVLVNTVERAQRTYLDLKGKWPDGTIKPELILLHSRFFPDDRKAKEQLLHPMFGPDAVRSQDVILVTTQVVEAGIDISAELLLTELAPMNALVQRAGRTARYQAPRNIGTVIVYELEENEKGVRKLGPYRDERALIDATRALLETIREGAMVAANADELRWIEAVHAQSEREALNSYETMGHGHARRTRVDEAMDDKARSHLRTLVRDITAVNVLITHDPEGVSFSGRKWPLLLSVDPGFLASKLEDAYESNHAPWVAKGARPTDYGESRDLRFQWEAVQSPLALRREWLIAIHPNHASYDLDHGLVIGQGGPPPRVRCDEVPPRPSYSYRFESWHDHTRAVMEQASAMARSNPVGAAKLAEACGVDSVQVEDWVRLVCALHDIGKLQTEWQKSAWSWQRERDARQRRPAKRDAFIAHTDYDPRTERELQRRRGFRLPNHAMEGALAALPGLTRSLSDADLGTELTRDALVAIVWAVGRHHASRARLTTVPESFQLHADAGTAVARVLRTEAFTLAHDSRQQQKARRILERPDLQLQFRGTSNLLWPFYCFLARRLRLADQEGTRRGRYGPTA